MNAEELRTVLNRLEELHSSFEEAFSELVSGGAGIETIKVLHELSSEKLELSTRLYKELTKVGGRAEEASKDLYRNEHQMKFRLEELLSLAGREDFTSKARFKSSLERLIQFHRLYDYAVRKDLGELSAEIEGLAFLGENQKKVPVSILEEIRKTREIEGRLERLISFVRRLYSHPADVYRAEEALKAWHSRGLLWVEARNVEKLSGVRDAGEILEGLTLIGVVEKKMRGGESVYRHRAYGED
ncbi:hypothetical protein [Thermococcus sp.]|uniref:hypothetical protein n=1 Tax=Thermococcus sp. TaxID=35749 RepID=UPI00261BCAEC|nr:hypothetical protein [Thermococcus sp.]